jgi:hypothetical protein
MEKKKIHLYLSNIRVTGYGEGPAPSHDLIEIEVDSNHDVLKIPHAYIYREGELIREESHVLKKMKISKAEELDANCKKEILGRFKSTFNDVEYEFSYDMEAQSRFNGVPYLFTSNIITEVEWNAYLNGERTSLVLDKASFDKIAADAFAHQMFNITKYRQKIELIDSAKTLEEINLIKW